MAVFRCKMCGGSLEVTDGMTVCECEYCGTKQTLPAFDNEKKINLFNRANRLRFKCNFDGANTIYQSIVSEFPNESEAYWGLCLCKYGIEYVEDTLTGNKIPTCHRTLFDSILNDADYHAAIKNADSIAKSVYESEAKAIDVLQQKILSVVKNEKPYDVFICYKETDTENNRTFDSVLAQDIYDQLTSKGLKVFFSRITLEDKLGVDYEPYIFAALNSAKVMLVVTTSLEYVESTWVKNEWARFARLAIEDKSKVIIPCYSGIDPEELPAVLTSKQSQDMNKIGAMQDLIRGIGKIVSSNNSSFSESQMHSREDMNVTPLLKRARIFLENNRWEEAKEYTEKVLDIDPESADAYVIALMAEYKVNNVDELCDLNSLRFDFSLSFNYINAVKYGRQDMVDCFKESLYRTATWILGDNTVYDLSTAVILLKRTDGYKNSTELITKYTGIMNEKIYSEAQRIASNNTESSYLQAIQMLRPIAGYKQSNEMIAQFENDANMMRSQREQQVAMLCEKRTQINNAYQSQIANLNSSIDQLINKYANRTKSSNAVYIIALVLAFVFGFTGGLGGIIMCSIIFGVCAFLIDCVIGGVYKANKASADSKVQQLRYELNATQINYSDELKSIDAQIKSLTF